MKHTVDDIELKIEPEFRITAKGCISKIVAHNKKRHNGKPFVVFREAIHIKKNEWKIIDYPPDGNSYCEI